MVLENSLLEAHAKTDGEVAGDDVKTQSTPTDTQTQKAHPRNGVPKSQLPKRPKKPKAENKLASVIRQWLTNVCPQPTSAETIESLVSQAPKRWVIYEPMVLLPTGSFGFTCVPGQVELDSSSKSPEPRTTSWQNILASASDEQKNLLWRDILEVLSPGTAPSSLLTHLAVNEGIPLHVGGESTEKDTSEENILRSPTGLRPLYGDFGPATTQIRGHEEDPSDEDLATAFWVSTKQNGLYQTWAPRWSMFSRGNIKEKARLLAWPGIESTQKSQNPCTAVDLYAGIGYFVFSYAQRGMRVLGWELNPWSTEALQRGALRNGWTVKIVRGADLALPTTQLVGDEQIVIFVEDNQNAGRRLAELRQSRTLCITHVNGGLLPTSRPIWRTAWDAVVDSNDNKDKGKHTGWLHLHDNVGVHELDSRKAEIQALVDAWGESAEGPSVESVVEHTELVKTFAPGVWHCVFDVIVSR